jgi:hypothetical protein
MIDLNCTAGELYGVCTDVRALFRNPDVTRERLGSGQIWQRRT